MLISGLKGLIKLVTRSVAPHYSDRNYDTEKELRVDYLLDRGGWPCRAEPEGV